MKFDHHDMEYATGTRRAISGWTVRKLQMLKHSRCACGEAARALIGGDFFCRGCAEVERTLREGKRLIEMARL